MRQPPGFLPTLPQDPSAPFHLPQTPALTLRRMTLHLRPLLLLAACGIVAGLFYAATRSTHRHLAASLMPIIVGYMVAHYLTLLVETGQQTVIQMSDPLGTGADVMGIGDRQVDIWLSLHPGFLATIKALSIVLGHVVGVIAAHDRSIELLPRERRTSGQIPLLLVMILYTFTGLYLLFGT